MDKYSVIILAYAYRNLDDIYGYITSELLARQAAENIVDKLEKAILSLEYLPFSGAIRRTGKYANKGYRQIFVKNFTIVYRINTDKKEVVILTVKYSRSEF